MAKGIAVLAAVGCALTVGILLWGPQREPERSPSCEEISVALRAVLEDPLGQQDERVLVDAGLGFEVRLLTVSYAEMIRAASAEERSQIDAAWTDGVHHVVDETLDEVDCPPAP